VNTRSPVFGTAIACSLATETVFVADATQTQHYVMVLTVAITGLSSKTLCYSMLPLRVVKIVQEKKQEKNQKYEVLF
jgi:hypothetical protein